MQEIEVKAATMEADNLAMQQALAHASEQETRSIEERTRLYSEIAALRERVSPPPLPPLLPTFSLTTPIDLKLTVGLSHLKLSVQFHLAHWL
jgi:hypothetical protein